MAMTPKERELMRRVVEAIAVGSAGTFVSQDERDELGRLMGEVDADGQRRDEELAKLHEQAKALEDEAEHDKMLERHNLSTKGETRR